MSIENRIDEFSRGERAAVMSRRENGGLVAGYFSTQFPAEILAGFGLHPVRLAEGAFFDAERNGEKLVRPDACSYCKSLVGNFNSKSGLFGAVDIIVGVITCDMMRRTLEVLDKESGIPVFQLQMPATRSRNAEEYFISEVERTAKDIRAFLGIRFDCGKAHSFFNARKTCVGILDDIVCNGKLTAVLSHRLLHLFNVARPEKLELFLKSLKPELKPRKSKHRILVAGSILCLEDDLVYRILQENGAGVVPMGISENALTEFYRGAKLKANTEKRMISELAANSFKSDICIRQRPNFPAYEKIKDAVASEECDGVILKCMKFCDIWYSEKERMKQELDVPLLVLDTTYSGSEEERIRNRMEAFLEML
ncbi:MAG: 2-hydroxyacyl-CoA dehydratase family protein [Victivallales bacterium]|jgi:benzoyl-CoA reductase/2-hydroxyglutaryl-CoA dehydratase subunit BcrC/BadD/HgdB